MVQLQHPPHPAGEVTMGSRPRTSGAACDGRTSGGAAREPCLAAQPSRAACQRLPEQAGLGTTGVSSRPAWAGTECLPQSWPGSSGRERLKGKWMGSRKNNKTTTLQLFEERLDFPNTLPQIQSHQTRRQV